MMPAAQAFDDIAPTEGDTFTFDFTRLLATSEGIVSSVWTLSVDVVDPSFTRDPSPASRLSGSATTTAADPTKSSQKIAIGCYPGNRYLVVCAATTTQGNVKVLYTSLWCRDPRGLP